MQNGQTQVHCPAHDDKRVSLKVWKSQSPWGFKIECSAGCTLNALGDALYDRGLVLKKNGPASPLSILLYEIAAYLKRYVVFASCHQVTAVALWVAHTYAIEGADTTPYLAITAPEKASGKTRLLETLEMLVVSPWRTVRPSEAALFHEIDANHCTLLLDETDTIFKSRMYESFRGALNAGHRRGSTVGRYGKTTQKYDPFGAKALAGLGTLPDTVMSRSIPIRLARRLPSERITKFRYRKAGVRAASLRARLDSWAQTSLVNLRAARPKIPKLLDDRAQDGWEPLLAIADEAGGDWPRWARAAALALHSKTRARGANRDQAATRGEMLLRAIRDIFKEKQATRIFTEDLLKALLTRDDGVWAEEWGDLMENGTVPQHNILKGGARISRLLSPYQIMPKTIRVDGHTGKGYVQAQFKNTWKRYLRR